MTLSETLQRVFDLADKNAVTPEDREAADSFHDFVVNCPWLAEDEEEQNES
jgi:hypothetical protein